jgi:hypothetical protein
MEAFIFENPDRFFYNESFQISTLGLRPSATWISDTPRASVGTGVPY